MSGNTCWSNRTSCRESNVKPRQYSGMSTVGGMMIFLDYPEYKLYPNVQNLSINFIQNMPVKEEDGGEVEGV